MSAKMSEYQVCFFDFTLSLEAASKWCMAEERGDPIKTISATLDDHAKQWVFQLEESDSGFKHYQGRLNLRKKRRLGELPKILQDTVLTKAHFSTTSTGTAKGKQPFSYVLKGDTRIDGPWMDKDQQEEEVYIPRQYRIAELTSAQQEIVDICSEFHTREIHGLYCPDGGTGKSTIAALMELQGKGYDIPPYNDFDKLIQGVCNMLMDEKQRQPGALFFDMPRAMNKSQLNGFYMAVEQCKKGKVWDMRYHYKKWWFDSPCIWVFTNTKPDLNLLSRDRWVWHTIEDDELIDWNPESPDVPKWEGARPTKKG